MIAENIYMEQTVEIEVPQITVTYDNNMVSNDCYYNSDRIASVTISDPYFESGKVEILNNEEIGADNTPNRVGVEAKGQDHTINLSFSEEGSYGYTVKCKDETGNDVAEYVSEQFVIDKTAPEVTVEGISDECIVEKDTTQVDVNISDNIELSDMTIYVNGESFSQYDKSSLEAASGQVSIVLPQSDDYQNITVVGRDMAGNRTKKEFKNVLVSKNAAEIVKKNEAKQMASKQQKATIKKKSSKKRREKVAFSAIILFYIVMAGYIIKKGISKKGGQ